MLLEDKVCLVTGSSRGIGAETVVCMAREGAKVAINYYGLTKLPITIIKTSPMITGAPTLSHLGRGPLLAE